MSRGLFDSKGTTAMVVIYFALAAAFITMISGVGKSLPWGPLLGILWVPSCAASCFGFMSLFARFATRRLAMLDSLTNNAYGMYLIHYAFVSLAPVRTASGSALRLRQRSSRNSRHDHFELGNNGGPAPRSSGGTSDLKKAATDFHGLHG